MAKPATPPALSPMTGIEVPTELLLDRIAERFVDRLVCDDRFVERVAAAFCSRFELLNPEAAAAVLNVAERTLRMNHTAWGLDKSVAFGPENPRYFLSQILQRARGRVIAGRKNPEPRLLSAAA